jgi:hypothetical protein
LRPTGRDAWNWALALPCLLTVCLIAYIFYHLSVSAPSAELASAAIVRASAASPSKELSLERQDVPRIPVRPTADETTRALAAGSPSPTADHANVFDRIEHQTDVGADPQLIEPRSTNALPRDRPQSSATIVREPPPEGQGYVAARELQPKVEAKRPPPAASLGQMSGRARFSSATTSAPRFVGTWVIDAEACSSEAGQEGWLQTIITSNGATAGDASCSFERKQQVGSTWKIVASCTDGHERWTANIQLTPSERRLTWRSERGTQAYVKCG